MTQSSRVSHPILTKLGITSNDLTLLPKKISDLNKMIFIKNGNNGLASRILVTRNGNPGDDFYLPPNSVENIHADDDEIVKVKAIVELNTLFDLEMKPGDVLILDDSLRIAEHVNMRNCTTSAPKSPSKSHPILTKLGVQPKDLTIEPKNIADLSKMIFLKNGASAGWAISIWVTRKDGHNENFYLTPNSVENIHVDDDEVVNVKGVVELNTIFDKEMKSGDVLILDDHLRVAEYTNMRSC